MSSAIRTLISCMKRESAGCPAYPGRAHIRKVQRDNRLVFEPSQAHTRVILAAASDGSEQERPDGTLHREFPAGSLGRSL